MIFSMVSAVSDPVEGATLLAGVGVAAALVAGAADDAGTRAELGALVAAGIEVADWELATEEAVTTGATGTSELAVGADVEP